MYRFITILMFLYTFVFYELYHHERTRIYEGEKCIRLGYCYVPGSIQNPFEGAKNGTLFMRGNENGMSPINTHQKYNNTH